MKTFTVKNIVNNARLPMHRCLILEDACGKMTYFTIRREFANNLMPGESVDVFCDEQNSGDNFGVRIDGGTIMMPTVRNYDIAENMWNGIPGIMSGSLDSMRFAFSVITTMSEMNVPITFSMPENIYRLAWRQRSTR